MTAFLRAFLFCNSCDSPFDSSTVPSASTVREARREAKRRGWGHKRDGRDLCEDCADVDTAPAVRSAAVAGAEAIGRRRVGGTQP